MKTRILFPIFFTFLVLSGCFVASYYPLYTQKDLFANSLLLGEWQDEDSTVWRFSHISSTEKDKPPVTDDTGYYLKFQEKGKEEGKSSLEVRVVRLEGIYFLDFFINKVEREGYPDFFDLHTLPVHTFARLTLDEDSVSLNWMDPEWVKNLAKDKKLKVRHLVRDDEVFLTAGPRDLQKFMVKYTRTEEAYKKGTSFTLGRADTK